MTFKGFLRALSSAGVSRGQRVTQANPLAKLPFGTSGRVIWKRGERVGILTDDGRVVFTGAYNCR